MHVRLFRSHGGLNTRCWIILKNSRRQRAADYLREQGLERRSVTLRNRPDYLGFPTDSHIFEKIASIGRPSSPFESGILGRALAELGDTGGRYYWFWHLRGNILISQVAAPMPPGLSWSSSTCLCTPEIAAPSPPGGRWLQYRWMHARGQPVGKS